MSNQILIMVFEALMASYGGPKIDNYLKTEEFPSASMLTGILANAMGWKRVQRDQHQELQDRIEFAARIDRETATGIPMRDYQTAGINRRESGWTTRGELEERSGGEYQIQQIYRDYLVDSKVTAALRLRPGNGGPALDDLARALLHPVRPLFIGRKTCLPSTPIYLRTVEAGSPLSALLDLEIEPGQSNRVKLMWPDGERDPRVEPARTRMVADQRNWKLGLHGGVRRIHEGTVRRDQFPEQEMDQDGFPLNTSYREEFYRTASFVLAGTTEEGYTDDADND